MPIVDASVTMSPDGENRKYEVHSDNDGGYKISMLHAPGNSVLVRVSKQGYAPVERKLHSRGEPLNENFTLEPDTSNR